MEWMQKPQTHLHQPRSLYPVQPHPHLCTKHHFFIVESFSTYIGKKAVDFTGEGVSAENIHNNYLKMSPFFFL